MNECKPVVQVLRRRRLSVRQGLPNIARHGIGCHLTQDTRVQNALGEEASYNCHTLPATMPPRHDMVCHSTQESRIQNAFGDDVASNYLPGPSAS
jgi:hypothetical protein